MKKSFFSFGIIALFLCGFSGAGEIEWSIVPLQFSDFQGKVPAGTSFAALTTSTMHMSTQEGENGELTFQLYCAFDKQKSWMKVKTDYILNHEQKHFDLSEAFTKKLEAELNSLSETKNVMADANKLFVSENSLCEKMQQQYDNETKHGINEVEQQRWNQKIDSLLNVTY